MIAERWTAVAALGATVIDLQNVSFQASADPQWRE